MKCYEAIQCPLKDRESCFVWNSFRDTLDDMENIKCWILKGGYHEGNEKQYKKCQQCAYYRSINQDSGVALDAQADLATVTCEGTINNERNKALEKIWQTLKSHGKTHVLLDLSKVHNIYSSGLGAIITIHKETKAIGGLLVVLCPDVHIKNLFQVSKLSRIITIVDTLSDAQGALHAHQQLQGKKAAQPAPQGTERLKPRQATGERPACHVYWKNKNPHNATTCDECFKKMRPSLQPCWIVDGMIEGVSFQYVNEDCERCSYYEEFRM